MNTVDICDAQYKQGREVEVTALSNAEYRIPVKTVPAIRNLMDASVPDRAGKAFTSILNDMLSISGKDRYKALDILSVQASAIGCTTLTTDAYTCETIWRSLLYNLRLLSALDSLADGSAAESLDIIYDLWRSRANGNIASRATAVKAAFFWLYDNWENIAHSIASVIVSTGGTLLMLEGSKSSLHCHSPIDCRRTTISSTSMSISGLFSPI